MRSIHVALCILGMVSISVAQPVHIQGTVTNAAGQPLAGAEVMLGIKKLSDTTDANGVFVLQGEITSVVKNTSLRAVGKEWAELHNGVLSITLANRSEIEITAFSLMGEEIFTTKRMFDGGVSNVTLSDQLTGVALYRVRSGERVALLKVITVSGSVRRNVTFDQSPLVASREFSKKAVAPALINDTLIALRLGYKQSRLPITTSDTSGIVLSMSPLINLPGRMEAEDFNTGGEGTGYHDLSPGNKGTALTTSNVDIDICTDVGGGYNIGFIDAGEWLAYDVSVAQSDVYALTMRMASAKSGTKTAIVTVDGATVATLNFTDSTGGQSWKNVAASYISLSAGTHSLRIVMTSGGFNFNYLDFSSQGANVPPVASAGTDLSGSVNTGITLNGSSSFDPDNGPKPLTYSWTQITGRSMLLTGATTAQPKFTPTAVGGYTFRLTVSDGSATSSDEVVVTIKETESLAILEPAEGMYLGTNNDAGLTAANYNTTLGFKAICPTVYVVLNNEGWNWLRSTASQQRTQAGGCVWATFMAPRNYVVDDTILQKIAQVLAAEEIKGSSFFITIGHEMNLDNGDYLRPLAFKNMFRKFALFVHQVTARTAVIWLPNVAGSWWPGTFKLPPQGSDEWNEIDIDKNGRFDGWEGYAAFYPGDDAADWVGMDVYNGGNDPRAFENVLNYYFYNEYCVKRKKPMAIMETAATWNTSKGDELTFKRSWYSQVFNVKGDNSNAVDVADHFPKLKYVGWFDRNKEYDYRISANNEVRLDWLSYVTTLKNGRKYFLDADDFKRLNP